MNKPATLNDHRPTGIFADIYDECLSILPTNFKVAPAYRLPVNESFIFDWIMTYAQKEPAGFEVSLEMLNEDSNLPMKKIEAIIGKFVIMGFIRVSLRQGRRPMDRRIFFRIDFKALAAHLSQIINPIYTDYFQSWIDSLAELEEAAQTIEKTQHRETENR